MDVDSWQEGKPDSKDLHIIRNLINEFIGADSFTPTGMWMKPERNGMWVLVCMDEETETELGDFPARVLVRSMLDDREAVDYGRYDSVGGDVTDEDKIWIHVFWIGDPGK